MCARACVCVCACVIMYVYVWDQGVCLEVSLAAKMSDIFVLLSAPSKEFLATLLLCWRPQRKAEQVS